MHNYSHKTSERNPQEPTMKGKLKPQKIMRSLTTAVLGEEEGTKPRKVLMSLKQFEQYIEDYL